MIERPAFLCGAFFQEARGKGQKARGKGQKARGNVEYKVISCCQWPFAPWRFTPNSFPHLLFQTSNELQASHNSLSLQQERFFLHVP